MIVSINQPAYLPWLGYFARILESDLHIVLDHVQYEKNSYTNRNRVRTSTGSTWLTVPIKTKGRFGDLKICELEIDADQNWATRHWRTLRQSYSRAPYFAQHSAFFEDLYARPWNRLSDLLECATRYVLERALGIDTQRVRSSDLVAVGKKSELVLNLCREVGASVYLSGPLGKDYLNEQEFKDAGIEVRYHDFSHPVYSQVYPGFETAMSVVDLLFNHGPNSLGILSGGDRR